VVLELERAEIEQEKLKLTDEALAAAQPPEEPPEPEPEEPEDLPESEPETEDTSPSPIFTASETMFCRAGPGTDYPDHWVVDEGKSYPVIAKWHQNDWLIVEMDDPGTRTKCCWIGGQGDLNVPLTSIPEIDYLPDRMSCNKPAEDVKVWDFNTEQYTTLSCGQITQSEWFFCNAGSGEYCTDVNYDGNYDYLVFKPDADAGCNLPGDFFQP
jgi:hypothetical protein